MPYNFKTPTFKYILLYTVRMYHRGHFGEACSRVGDHQICRQLGNIITPREFLALELQRHFEGGKNLFKKHLILTGVR